MLIVQKYGGTSLKDAEHIFRAARRAAQLHCQGHQIVVVVSAQGETTDELIEKAARINKHRAAREMDAYLAAGEQMSAGLMAMAIGSLGCSAVSLTGWQAGIRTDGIHGNAKILKPQLDALVGLQQGGHDQKCGHTLADDGGQGHTFHTHIEGQDEQQIQHRVENRADHQEIKRPLGVAHSPQNTRTDVVQH